MHINV